MRPHERANRDLWNRWSDGYQAGHGAVISEQPAAWGAWRFPESELRVLPDVAGLDVLELGCGGAQWIERFREHGLSVEAMREPPVPAGARSTFYGEAVSSWAARWPAEVIWTVRRLER